MDYIKQLLAMETSNKKSIKQCDIGVVTPYKLQCKRIAQACRVNNFHDIKVGTAEVFQGQEKPIIIVSTVRSDDKNLGFVDDARVGFDWFAFKVKSILSFIFLFLLIFQRMNVILTRAKCLLIIIGNPSTLKLNSNWATLIQHCNMHKALV